MAYRKYLLILFTLYSFTAGAQINTYQQADSTSYAQYLAGNWQQLIDFGRKTINNGTDFPELRLRMAYAYFITQNYTAALQQYQAVLANDSYNQTARNYVYWCNIYLNRTLEADHNASFIDQKTLNKEQLAPVLTDIGLEFGLKFTNEKFRGTANYSRIFAGNRLGWRWQAQQSVAYYNRADDNPIFHQQNPNFKFDPNQFEYYGKLSFLLNQKLVLLGAYHFLETQKASHVALFGLKMTDKNVEWQTDFNYSYLNNLHIYQYNGRFNWYPFGNLNFYTITSPVLQHFSNYNQFIFTQLFGGKILKKLWTDGYATFGKQDDYLESDALYVYNSVDVTTFKSGLTVYYQLNTHLLLPINYMFERKKRAGQQINYDQHSITATLLWRF